MEQNLKRVLDINECAELTGYSRLYLYQLTSQGIIPFSKPRKKLFFDRVKVENWLLSNPSLGQVEREKLSESYLSNLKNR
jgi:hypothetical protein